MCRSGEKKEKNDGGDRRERDLYISDRKLCSENLGLSKESDALIKESGERMGAGFVKGQPEL